ncbi:hyalin-like isoform X2 [Amphiura filiformis]|uniref:hyalin-like isoform X2 n=1 Tax=Amphiura filiformis TaxID=82378 RepID=UPI003B21BB26
MLNGMFVFNYFGVIFICNIEVDTTPPVINGCPGNKHTTTELGTSMKSVTWIEPTATDLSGTPSRTLSHEPGASFTTGVTTVRYTFTDTANNVATCTFTVTLETVDTTPPQISGCPNNIQASIELGTSTKSVSWTEPTATDLSGTPSRTRSHQPGTEFSIGVTDVGYTFADTSNNVATCNFSITLETVDTIPPEVVSCPSDIFKQIELGTHSIPVYWSPPSAIDLSGNVSLVSQSRFPGDKFTAGRWTVVYRFADGSENEASCSFGVLLEEVDTIAPLVELCPDDITQTIELGATSATVSWTEPQASDLSGNVTMSPRSRIPTTFSPFAETPVKYVFEDASGNENTCEFFVSFEIVDTTPPDIITCPKDIHTTTEVGTSGISVSWSIPFAMDHSGIILTSATHEPGHMFPVGSTDVIYIFKDESGNQDRCNFTVNIDIVDTIPPEISICSSDISETIELGDVYKMIYWPEPEAFDNSKNVSLVFQSHYSGDYFKEGRTDVSYVFTDGSGNMASCNFSITLIAVDTKAPEILECPSDIFKTIEARLFGFIVTWKEPLVTDASGNTTLLVKTHSSGTFFTIGKTCVTYLFVDPSNNMATCNFHISIGVVDSLPPDIGVCPSDMRETIELGDSLTRVYWSEAEAFDSSVSLAFQSHRSGDYFTVGRTDVSYLFTDGSVDLGFCNFSITLISVDTKAPEILECPSDIFKTIEAGLFGSIVTWKEPLVTDASGNTTLLVKKHSSGAFFTIGNTSVTYVFVDPSNNMATCKFHITIDMDVLQEGSLDSQTSSLIGLTYDQMTWIFITAVGLAGLLSFCLIVSLVYICKMFRRNKKHSDDTELEDRNLHIPIAAPFDIETSSTF